MIQLQHIFLTLWEYTEAFAFAVCCLVFSTSISFPGWFLLVILDSPLAWRIPRTGEPGGLPFMGSHRVGHDWSDLAAAAAIATFIESPFLINWSKKAKQFLFHIIYHSLKSSCYFISVCILPALPSVFLHPRTRTFPTLWGAKLFSWYWVFCVCINESVSKLVLETALQVVFVLDILKDIYNKINILNM